MIDMEQTHQLIIDAWRAFFLILTGFITVPGFILFAIFFILAAFYVNKNARTVLPRYISAFFLLLAVLSIGMTILFSMVYQGNFALLTLYLKLFSYALIILFFVFWIIGWRKEIPLWARYSYLILFFTITIPIIIFSSVWVAEQVLFVQRACFGFSCPVLINPPNSAVFDSFFRKK
jgi:hypothetical protein